MDWGSSWNRVGCEQVKGKGGRIWKQNQAQWLTLMYTHMHVHTHTRIVNSSCLWAQNNSLHPTEMMATMMTKTLTVLQARNNMLQGNRPTRIQKLHLAGHWWAQDLNTDSSGPKAQNCHTIISGRVLSPLNLTEHNKVTSQVGTSFTQTCSFTPTFLQEPGPSSSACSPQRSGRTEHRPGTVWRNNRLCSHGAQFSLLLAKMTRLVAPCSGSPVMSSKKCQEEHC